MFSVLSLKWKLLTGGLICALLVALSGGAGVWSLHLIHTAIEETTGDISKNIAYQNRQVRQITRLRKLISAIQNAESPQTLENLFQDLSVLFEELEAKPTQQNRYFSDAITDLLIKQQNLFVSRLDIEDKRAVNNESLKQIAALALNIMDNVQFESDLSINDAFEQMKKNIFVVSESGGSKDIIRESYVKTDNITSSALQAIKSASLIHVNCSQIDAFMKEIFSLYDVDYIRYRTQEIHTLLNNTRQEIENLPGSDDTWKMSKLLVSFRTITDQVAESQERVLRQEIDFSETIKQIFKEISAAEKEILQVVQTMKSDADQTLQSSSTLVKKWQNFEFLLMAIAFVLAILIGLILSRSVLRQLSSLNEGIKVVGKGDLAFKVDTGTGDEIGILSRAFDDMAANIQKSQAELGRALEEAKEANQAKSEFLANMSHELRTPLNAILGFTQIMERNPELSSVHKEELGIIGRSGEHLLGLINDVLNIAKIESGQSSLNDEVFDLRRLLQGIEEMFSVRAKLQHIQFLMDVDSQTPAFVEGDAGKIRQILINIIGNAIKFTKQGFVSLKLECQLSEDTAECQQEQLNLRFEVEDSGIGIAQEKLDTIFDPFVQAGQSKEMTSGTGLGLAISRKFIILLGGEISARSQEGHGSSFRFTLPVKPASGVGVESGSTGKRIIGLAADQPEYRILIVEDRPENRMLLRKLMQIVGFEVLEAKDGKEGVEIFTSEEPDFVWMDMQMPVMDGYEASRIIKQSSAGRKTPVIALTASALEEQRELILAAGCDDVISKPFKEDELFSILHQYLGVTYIYEDIEEPAIHIEKENKVTKYMKGDERLSLPTGIVIELSVAALELDGDKCLNIIDRIRAIDEDVADVFCRLVENYQFEELHTLVDEANKKQEH